MSLLILIAEDDPGVRMAVHGYLETFGYSVIMAQDGEQALVMIQEYHPHLLISDINMPKKNGYELVKEIRKFPAFRLLPVIFLTEYDEVADRVKGYQVGCDVYLAKPFEVEELEAIIRNLLERSQIFHTELNLASNQYQNLPQNTEEITHILGNKQEEQLSLTEKEKQVLALVVRGFSNINIGKELHLSPRTIEKYVSRLLRKTDTKNRAELIRLALENNVV
jgi:DNA-binding NarL/FixJ family response regulator